MTIGVDSLSVTARLTLDDALCEPRTWSRRCGCRGHAIGCCVRGRSLPHHHALWLWTTHAVEPSCQNPVLRVRDVLAVGEGVPLAPDVTSYGVLPPTPICC